MRDRIETLILFNLLANEDYTRKVLPFLQPEYFSDKTEKIIFNCIHSFIVQYNTAPTQDTILITINQNAKIGAAEYEEVQGYIKNYLTSRTDIPDQQWLLDKTEDWCKEKAIYNAILGSIKILDDKTGKFDRGMIPKLLTDALAVGFNADIGHDYFLDSEKRYDFYHRVEKKIEFDLDLFNKITDGGLTNKTLNVVVAGTGIGKSLFLTHCAAHYLSQTKNVLYITLEMAKERIAERIDSNLLNIPLLELKNVPKKMYEEKISKLRNKANGNLIIQEYPTASAHVGHFRHLLNELHLKKNFLPHIIIVDYINICASFRIKAGSQVNSYTYVKSIAEELRGLAMEFNVPLLTATQTNRSGQNNTDVDFENVSESHGLSATADFMVAMISTEELEQMNQVLFKQIKNRYNDVSRNRRFVVGIDRSKMRLYNVDPSAQEELDDAGQDKEDTPGFDKTKFGQGMKAERDFSKIKV